MTDKQTRKPAPRRAPRVRLGAHISIAGGIDRAVPTARDVGCEVLQVFVKSNSQWRAAPFRDGETRRFRDNLASTGLGPAVAHDSYLINLCSPDEALWTRSCDALRVELDRCEALGIGLLVTHPGAHTGSGEAAGLDRLVRALDEIHASRPRQEVMVLLETTAGQGSSLGHRFEHLSSVRRRVAQPERVGVCLDTCHVFAAGYDLRTPAAYRETMERFDDTVGLDALRAIHLNDSKRELGSRVDRHEQIGAGRLGLRAFDLLLNDPRLREVPMILETPKGPDYAEDRINLTRLRSLVP